MNIIKFNIELEKNRSSEKEKPIKEIISENFIGELDIDNPNIHTLLEDEWGNIEYKTVCALKPNSSIIGYSTSNSIRIFLFTKNSNGINAKNNLTLEIIALGDLPVEQILNDSFSKIQDINKNLCCKYIDNSRIFIFPFDSNSQDIYDYELKIRADLKSPYKYEKNDFIRWSIVFLALVVIISLFSFSSDPDFKSIYISLGASAIFYLFTDIILYIVVPFFRKKNHRNVQINNLSSFVETGKNPNNNSNKNNNRSLEIPEV